MLKTAAAPAVRSRPLLPLKAGHLALAWLPDSQLVQGRIVELLPDTDEVRFRIEDQCGYTRDLFLPTWRCCAVSQGAAASMVTLACRLAEVDLRPSTAEPSIRPAGPGADAPGGRPQPAQPTPQPQPPPRRRRALPSAELAAFLFLLTGAVLLALSGAAL